uniref:ESCRT-II complex subunit VPS25 n=1 Tax=Kwoniella pini CBS 10737 TaxID=1296096 RepID=A0A1B9HUY9_9TREE|nr:uncharacterized protein I206_06859 [Kwoniella pini CBS 10737]OCF47084.1 hypothetical protein I206_06859 [Kwoniella pini CBS 10737]
MSINQISSTSFTVPSNQEISISTNTNINDKQINQNEFTNSNSNSITTTPLRSIKGKNGFEYPAIWNFPPFFTLQPNTSTLLHQIEIWRKLIIKYSKYQRIFEIIIDSNELEEIFENKKIKRKLLNPSLKRILQEMSKNGEAAPDPPKQDNRYLIYWKKPDEWADLIYNWIIDNGLNSKFYELPIPILRKALENLVKRGKAQLLEGKGEIGEGVRFL